MQRLRRLLAASDFSQSARYAAERAAILAQETGAALALLHVAPQASLDQLRHLAAGAPADLEQRLLETDAAQLQQLADELEARHGVQAGVHVSSGPLLQELVEQIDRLAADIPVIGSHGAGGLRRLLLGSTAERLLSKTLRPMLVVKQAPQGPYRRVLVPVDFSPATLPALTTARALAPHAEIVLLHAFAVPFEGQLLYAGVEQDEINRYRVAARQEATERLRELPGQAGVPSHSVTAEVVHGYPVPHIVEQTRARGCDLIVMGKHGRGMLEEILLGSVTRRVLAESPVDVAVSV